MNSLMSHHTGWHIYVAAEDYVGRHHLLDQTPPVAVNGNRPGGWSGCGLARELVLRTQS